MWNLKKSIFEKHRVVSPEAGEGSGKEDLRVQVSFRHEK